MKNVIDGIMFRGMVYNALNNIYNNEKRINSMNVFPVADGDTGTNMRLTLEHGYKKAKSNKHLGLYLKDLSAGMLLGARGNSGVILSQLFKGMAVALRSCGVANPREIKEALIRGYKTAYRAVINPTEGTILTVAREGIDNIKEQIRGSITINQMFALYLKEMKESQLRTPDLLPVLKDAGVLDSGAEGYIVIVEGMYKFLLGEKIENEFGEIKTENTQETGYFDENSTFEEGYCMEFLLQLMNSKNYKKTFRLDAFIETLKFLGNSLVVLQEGSIVKVHIHTLVPNEVMALSRQYGEYISFKLENMQLQHNEYIHEHPEKEVQTHKDFGVIAVVDGEGAENFFKEMNCHLVIQGGSTMNTSSEEFVNAIDAVNADHIVIFPNNSNIFEAANQAVKMANANNKVTIIPTRNILECYYALAMDLPDADYKTRIDALTQGSKDILSLSVSTAVKDFSSDSFNCKVGDKIGSIDEKMVLTGSSTLEVVKALLEKIDLDEKSGLIIFKGTSFVDSDEVEIREMIEDNYSLDVEFVQGDQHSYELLIGVI